VFFVSITRLRLHSWCFFPMFAWYAFGSAREATKAEGNVATRVLNDRNRTFWTATVWNADAAMKKFMLAGVHHQAMRKLPYWCDEAAVVHWTQENNEPPAWSEAHRRLEHEGRRSKVHHPSATHTAHKFPEPRVGRGNVRLK
jgi:hypothetical protein